MHNGYDAELTPWQVLVAVWLVAVAGFAVRRLARSDTRTVWFVLIVHVLFCGAPLVLDLVFAAPRYSYQSGFAMSQFDRPTNAIYLAYISAVPLLLLAFGSLGGGFTFARPPSAGVSIGWRTRALAWAALVAVPLALAVAPDPTIYLRYDSALVTTGADAASFHALLTVLLNVAIIGGVLLLTDSGGSVFSKLTAIPFLVASFWLNGKRALVAIAAMLLIYLLWRRGSLRGARLVLVGACATLGILVYSAVYQRAVRPTDERLLDVRAYSQSSTYADFRTDFGRDAIIKQTIFSELYPERMRVLEFRGQSLLFDVTFFVPRRWWPDKPLPYSVYATSAMLDIPVRDVGWGITTSWLEEAIANFGWWGLLLGPMVPGLVCAIGDRRAHPGVRSLTLIVASLLLSVHLAAFISLALLWLASLALVRSPKT